jgi:hypothetical protein
VGTNILRIKLLKASDEISCNIKIWAFPSGHAVRCIPDEKSGDAASIINAKSFEART